MFNASDQTLAKGRALAHKILAPISVRSYGRDVFCLRVFLASLFLFAAVVAFNGFPLLITDSIRYSGATPGRADAPLMLNFIMRLPYAIGGLWAPALLGMLATSYAAGRIAALDQFKPLRSFLPILFPALFLVTVLYIYAGMVGTELWFFVTMALITTVFLSRKVMLLDLVLIAIGAFSHASMFLISLGAVALLVIFFLRTWPRAPWVVAALIVGFTSEALIYKATVADQGRLRYVYAAGEILSNQFHIYEDYCVAKPEAQLCTAPYRDFINTERANPSRPKAIDKAFDGETQLFIWGPTSFWTPESRLSPELKLTRQEAEILAHDLWSYALRHHAGTLIGAFPAKAKAYWKADTPGFWVDFTTWTKDPRSSSYSEQLLKSLEGYEGSMQERGLFDNWHYQRASYLLSRPVIVIGLLAPLLLIFISTGPVWRLAAVFSGYVAGNFVTIAITGAIIGRYMDRSYVFLGLNCLLILVALWPFIAARIGLAPPTSEPQN